MNQQMLPSLGERMKALRENTLRRNLDLRQRPNTQVDFQLANTQKQVEFTSTHATEDLEIPHTLGVVPDTVTLGVSSNDARIYRGSREWTRTAIYLRSSAACKVDITPIAPPFPRDVFDGTTAVSATVGGGVPVGANPTAQVGLTVVNGVAATFMRSDASPPLNQAISPTMTGTWIWEPTANATPITIKAGLGQTADSLTIHYYDAGTGLTQPFATFGTAPGSSPALTLGYLGAGDTNARIRGTVGPATEADPSAAVMELLISNNLAAGECYALKISNEGAGKDYLIIGPTGEISVGFISGMQPILGTTLSFLGTTLSLSTAQEGVLGYLSHSNGSISAPPKISGIRGTVLNGVTGNVAGNYWGLRGDVSCSVGSDPTVGATELAAVVGAFSNTGADNALDYTTAITSRLRGAWPRVSGFRGCFIAARVGGSIGARPLILSTVYAPISCYADGTTGQCWAVETSAPSAGGSINAVAIAGGIKIAHPRRNDSPNYGVRSMHAHWIPEAAPAGGHPGNVLGDTTFDSGVVNPSGLYQHRTAWAKLIDQNDFVSYEDNAVFYEDDLVIP